jgi:predicted DNA-binding transcriptional regulator YafY
MTPRARQDALVRTLRRSGSSTIGRLAREVGASRRTVLRDIGALREEGVLIHSECGRGGGVRLDPQSARGAARVSVTEVFALLVSVAALRGTRSLPFAGLADTGLAKIERSLPADQVRDLRRLLACLHVGQISPKQDVSDVGPIDPALLPAFERAFLERLCLRFAYRDARGRSTSRAVEPQAMLMLLPLWYLVAWDPARAAFRHFRMDRISAPEVMEGVRFRQRHVPFEDDVCPFNAAAARLTAPAAAR